MEIPAARERVLEHERHRPGPGEFSAFWERGQWWQQAFDELVAAEAARDTLFEHRIAALPLGSDAARERLQSWAGGVRESIAWYAQLAKRLRKSQSSWSVDQKGRSLVPQELRNQLGRVESRHADCKSRAALIALEYLEYRRRLYGRLDEQDWQKAQNELREAFRSQVAVWRQSYSADLPDQIYDQRLTACERLHATQVTTLGLWDDRRDVDRNGLRRDIATVAGMIETLRRRKPVVRSGLGWGWVAAAVIVVVIVVAANSAASTSAPPADATAMPTESAPVVALVAAPLDPQTLNQQAIELMKQVRYKEAIELFQQAAAANPNSYEPRNNMAFCFYELGQHDEAIAQWRAALTLSNQNSPDANAGLGMALYVAGSRDEGFRYYQRASALNEDYRDESLLRSKYLWGDKAIADSRPLREQLTR